MIGFYILVAIMVSVGAFKAIKQQVSCTRQNEAYEACKQDGNGNQYCRDNYISDECEE